MSIGHVQFARQSDKEFIKTLRKRVKTYFEEKNISRKGNISMVFKTLFMLSLYFVPYALLLMGVFNNYVTFFAYFILMGFGMSGIGLSIMHDGNHGAYSKREWVNKLMGGLIYLVGGSAINWKMQHNVLHHTYTNIEGLDKDIENIGILRFNPHTKRKAIHKYQHIYAWVFYSLLTMSWMVDKDFKELFMFRRDGLTQGSGRSFASIFAEVLFFKLFYYFYVIAIPLMVIDEPWWIILIGIFSMHFLSGLILAAIFQPAHVLPTTEFPLPTDGKMEKNWMVHQLYTTSNFAPTKKLFSWFVGGLNFQVEHHLFPDICHVHYRGLAPIVKATAEEFNFPYHSEPTFRSAVCKHTQFLKRLGRED